MTDPRTNGSTDFDNPAEALASIKTARGAVGRNLDYPIGWDILFGLVLAAMVAGQALDQPWGSLILLMSLGAMVWMIRWWKERFGWWVNGYAPPRARWVAIGMAVVLIGLMGLSLWTRFWGGPWWAPLLAGGLAWIISILGGRLWMHVFRKELAERDL